MKKLNPTLEAQIRDARAKGTSYDDLAKHFKLSKGTVFGVVNRPATAAAPLAPAAPPAPVEAAPVPTGEPPSHDTIRAWLGEQVAALRGDCARYRAEGNASALAASTRSLTAASALLERATPAPPPSTSEGVFVKNSDLEASSKEGQEMLERLIKSFFEGQETWPVCRACHQKIPPADLGAADEP